MQLPRPFFRTLYLSAFSPKFYSELLRKPSSFSWRYFTLLHVLLSALYTIPVVVGLWLLQPNENIPNLTALYPTELEITVASGAVSINQELPYAIPVPATMKEERRDDSDAMKMENMVVFAPAEGVTGIESFLSYHSHSVITPTEIYALDADNMSNQLRVFQIPEQAESFVLTREKIDMFATAFMNNAFIKYKMYVPVIALLAFVVILCAVSLMRMIQLAFFTLFTWILSMLFLKDRKFTYGRLYLISLHSITLILIVDTIADFFGLHFFRGFVYFVAFLAWTMYVLSEANTSTAVRVESKTVKKKARSKKKV